MRLNEFADPKDYILPPEDVAAILTQLERVWRDHGIDDDSPFIVRLRKQPADKRRKLIDAV
jgi:hypothetical protein